METDSIFQELLKLSAEKQIPYTPSTLKKMSPERLLEVYNEYKAKELDSLNEYLTEIAIVKFEEVMKRFSLVKENSQLAKKLQEKTLFKKDIKLVVSYLTPLLPFVGLFEGSLVVVGEMIEKWGEKRENKTESNNEYTTSETEKGSQHDQTSTESPHCD